MFNNVVSLFFLLASVAAIPTAVNVANYAPVPIVTAAPSTYGSPYAGQANQHPNQVVDIDHYGVAELLPAVSQVPIPSPQSIPPPIPPPPFSSFRQPIAVAVPVNQPVGITHQVTVTNPQVVTQGYAPPPPIAPAPSAYGAPSPAYGAAPSNQQVQAVEQFDAGRPIVNQNFHQNRPVSPFSNSNGILESENGLDEWSGVGQAQEVKTKKSKTLKVRIH